MTTQDVARVITKELSLKEGDIHLALEGITLSSEDVIPLNENTKLI